MLTSLAANVCIVIDESSLSKSSVTCNQNRIILALRMILKLYHQLLAGCIFVDKVAGINTHAPDHGKWGLAELLEESLGEKIFVVHRLDKGTSGALLFARSAQDAKELAELFEKHQVQKKYLFLTDRKIAATEIKLSSHIEKEKGQFVSHRDKESNAHTHLLKLKSLPLGDLWEARPQTGKPHQIRLHAQEAGIPILGDDDHGGTPYARLCLHSLSLRFPWRGQEIAFTTENPSWVEPWPDLQELTLRESVLQRKRMYGPEALGDPSLRLSHNEIDSYRIDQFGEVLWIYWYREEDPSAPDLQRFERLGNSLKKKIMIRKMLNRGDDPNSNPLWTVGEPAPRWVARENNVAYELRNDTGLSPGLFLDQRENRVWVQAHAKGKSVLNLFSYTGGFSVNAALGKALEVVTVDVSANFLEWGKSNFEINSLDPGKYEFWASDAVLFLKGCVRRKRRFDLIICDPPSFGRSKNGTFSISKNYEELLTSCLLCLNKNGLILFSTNYEKWTLADLRKNLGRLSSQFSLKILEAPRAGLDFELPDQEPLMKSILLRKN